MARDVNKLFTLLREALVALPPGECDAGMLNDGLRSLADCQSEIESGMRLADESALAESVLKSLTPEQVKAVKRRAPAWVT
ncbi:MAG: hypothetical protein AB7P99_04675 [Vicinamibacterales bacterium]